MKEVKKEEIIKVLKKGKKIYLKGSVVGEERLYRYNTNSNCIEYSDDNMKWSASNMNLEDFKDKDWILFEVK